MDVSTIRVTSQDTQLIDQLAELAYAAFQAHAPAWLTTMDKARDEVMESLQEGNWSLALVDADREPLAWIGVVPHNSGRVWEIHPLVVRVSDQGKGHGSCLLRDVERLSQVEGAMTLFAGTSDAKGVTSLAGVNLYEDP